MINNEKNKFFDAFFKYHVGSDDKLQINLAWPNIFIYKNASSIISTCNALGSGSPPQYILF